MRQSVEKRCCHLLISEYGSPFREPKVRRNHDAGLLIELAHPVEQKSAPGLTEGQIPQNDGPEVLETGPSITRYS